MKLEESLMQRSNHQCELCQSTQSLQVYEVLPTDNSNKDNHIIACSTCVAQIDKKKNPIVHIGVAVYQLVCGVKYQQYK
jgi:protein PhnA